MVATDPAGQRSSPRRPGMPGVCSSPATVALVDTLGDEVEAGMDDDPGPQPGQWTRAWRILRRDPLFWVGFCLATLIVGASLLAPLLAPHPPDQEFRDLLPPDGTALPPSAMFPLGTDVAGRDYLSRLLYAGRSTLLVGLVANLAAVSLGTLVGLVAGYSGTVRLAKVRGMAVSVPVESVLMRITDIGLAFPVLLLAIAVTAVLGQSLLLVGVIIAAVLWTTTARLVYGRVLQLRTADYIAAAIALGVQGPRIIRRHILPHVLPLVVVLFSLGIAGTILFEASLSFLGAGAPISTPTWGRLLADHVTWYRTDLRLPLLPGLCIFGTVLAFNLMGDALRDALDPRAHRNSMSSFILSRIRWSIVILAVVGITAFLLTFVAPSDPARSIAGPSASAEAVARIRVSLGLERPALDQLLDYLARLLRGDLGVSYQLGGVRVLDLLLARLPATIELAVAGLGLALAIGVPLGVESARRPGSLLDRFGVVVGSVFVAVPTFLLAIVLLYVLAFRYRLLPLVTTGFDPLDMRALALPALVLGLSASPIYLRVTRNAMLDELRHDYIRTARAKGLRERQVSYHHAFRNVLPPVLVQAGLDFGFFLGGVVVIESVTGWPGIGRQAVDAITSEDIPVLMGTLLLATLCIVVANLVVDVFLVILDPRLRSPGDGLSGRG